MPAASGPSPEVLHLPAVARLGHLLGPAMPPKLPLPLRQRAMLHLPVFQVVQVLLLEAPAGAAGVGGAAGPDPLPHLPGGRGRAACYDTLVFPACASTWFHCCCIQVALPPAPDITPVITPSPISRGARGTLPPLMSALPQGQALRSALHHFCCLLCWDTQTFQAEMFHLSIKIPDRDAAWEEDRAFDDHYQQHSSCDTAHCLCLAGQEQLEEKGPIEDLTAAFQYLKAAYRKDGEGLLIRECSDRTRGNGFKLKEGRFRLDLDKEEILHYEGGETLEQVAQRSCGCPIPGSVQGQVG
ncbi:LOW QUALITY PROTEIN: hypothetical protein QYF61_025355 [Mycteria americana]|uniref:Uncharacterized protein n=1 Tax=Mycteria americana TaxID=33587 RepID=A0AAN7NW94_MYCAM|nr:LOW QUALITY PROTEIN: hypothetical protein QYF61_025355 [Mycteria americana]